MSELLRRTPVAVFTYNRPAHTQRALAALAACRRANECVFYLYSDGAKNESALAEVNATRRVLREWAEVKGAQVIERPSNFGLAKSVVTGVSELCERYGRVVVIEDDLIVSPDFLSYMIDALDKYETTEQVMQVGGFTLAPPEKLDVDAFFLPVTTTWGWATWGRAWQHFSWKPADYELAMLDLTWNNLFNLNGTWAFSGMLEDRLSGKNDSWGILWWYAVSRCRGLVLYPAQSMVWNGGFDGTGIHCGDGDFLQQGDAANYQQAKISGGMRFPASVIFDPEHLAILERFFRASQAPSAQGGESKRLVQKVINPFSKILRRVKHAIR